MSPGNKVLVTGGSGFLGQHVVKLLQTKADHVTEIRVLDIVPYTNKLDHTERLNVTSYNGSITDYNHVMEACKGVDCVMHVASVVDIRLFPDQDLCYNVNVIGTETVIRACQAAGVKRLIYCSSMDVVMSHTSIFDGNEDNTQPSSDHDNVFPVYGPTKAEAERLVLTANSPTLRTLSIRPSGMYGEMNPHIKGLLDSARSNGYYFPIKSNERASMAYVGNVAWSFLCAENTLSQDELSQGASGKPYFIADDSPCTDVYGLLDPMLQEAGATPFPIKLYPRMFLVILYLLYFIMLPLRMVSRVNISVGFGNFRFLTKTYTISHEKAKQVLGYEPLYSFKESHKRSVKYYREILERKHD